MSFGFERAHRITQRKQFEALYKSGKRHQDKYFRVFFSQAESDVPQLGISIRKRVGNAVERNRLKRLIREWFRTCKENLSGRAVIVQAKAGSAALELSEVVDHLNRLVPNAQQD